MRVSGSRTIPRNPKKSLLLAFDAFGTLFTPKAPIAQQYGEIARRYGIDGFTEDTLREAFRTAFKKESSEHPNYGKATGLGPGQWWENVIHNSLQPFLKRDQKIPTQLYMDLMKRFSTTDGYKIYPDVLPFFHMLRRVKSQPAGHSEPWKWDRTVVGVITNSDDRVPGVLKSLGLTVGPRKVGSSIQRSLDARADDDISFTVLSYDVGYEKPHPHMFRAGRQLLEETVANDDNSPTADKYELLYVGDDVEKDYLGAKAADWNALYLDRKDQFKEHLPEPNSLAAVKTEVGPAREERELEVIRDLQALSHWSP